MQSQENESVVSAPIEPAILTKLRKSWALMLALGVGLIILGIIAIVDSVAFAATAMIILGWVLIIAAILWAFQAIKHRQHRRLYVYVLNTILALVVGITLVTNPNLGATVFAVLFGLFLIITGVFRIIIALSRDRHAGWGWMFVEGLITVIIGILIWIQWPASGMQVIGIMAGIYLLIVGISQIMIALAIKALPKTA